MKLIDDSGDNKMPTDNDFINARNDWYNHLPDSSRAQVDNAVKLGYASFLGKLAENPQLNGPAYIANQDNAIENSFRELQKIYPNADPDVFRKVIEDSASSQKLIESALNVANQSSSYRTPEDERLAAEVKVDKFNKEQARIKSIYDLMGKEAPQVQIPDDVKQAASLLQNNSTYSTPATEAIASVTAQQASTPVDNPYMHTSIDGSNVFAPALGSNEAPINLTEEQLRDNGFTSNAIRNQGESVNQYIQESLAKMNELGNEEPSTSSDATAPLYVDRYDVGRYGPEAVANDSVLMNQTEFTNAYNTSVNKYLDTMNKYLSQFGNASPEAFGTLKANAKVDLPTSIDYVLKYKNVKGSDENKRMLSGFIENTFNTIKSDNSLPESVRNKITVGDIAYAIIKAPIQDRLASTDSTEIADDLHVPSDFYDTLKSSVQNKQADISSYNKLRNLHQNFSSYQKATEKLLQTQQNILNFTNRFPNADAMTEMDKTIDKGYKNLIKKQYNDYEKTAKTFSEYLK